MAIHAPITGAPTRALISHLQPQFALFNRAEIEAEIERLIGLLDACDGDPDLEDDDPALDPLDVGEISIGDRDDNRLLAKPLYDIDQSQGPINIQTANLAYQKWLRS